MSGRVRKHICEGRKGPIRGIVKVARPEYVHLVENEFFCMRLAARLRLEPADVEMREAGGRKFFLVERYDRAIQADRVRELHQEDFCQALGYRQERKYETDDDGEKIGPGLEEAFGLLDRASRAPGLDRHPLLRRYTSIRAKPAAGRTAAFEKCRSMGERLGWGEIRMAGHCWFSLKVAVDVCRSGACSIKRPTVASPSL
jgi:hypothetical protein